MEPWHPKSPSAYLSPVSNPHSPSIQQDTPMGEVVDPIQRVAKRRFEALEDISVADVTEDNGADNDAEIREHLRFFMESDGEDCDNLHQDQADEMFGEVLALCDEETMQALSIWMLSNLINWVCPEVVPRNNDRFGDRSDSGFFRLPVLFWMTPIFQHDPLICLRWLEPLLTPENLEKCTHKNNTLGHLIAPYFFNRRDEKYPPRLIALLDRLGREARLTVGSLLILKNIFQVELSIPIRIAPQVLQRHVRVKVLDRIKFRAIFLIS